MFPVPGSSPPMPDLTITGEPDTIVVARVSEPKFRCRCFRTQVEVPIIPAAKLKSWCSRRRIDITVIYVGEVRRAEVSAPPWAASISAAEVSAAEVSAAGCSHRVSRCPALPITGVPLPQFQAP